jgi:intracellular multiplication protein IcmC
MKIYRGSAVLSILLIFLPGVAHAALDLSTWLYNISAQVPDLVKLVVAVGYISGFGFLIGAVMKFKKCAQSTTMMSTQEGIGGPLIHLMVGVALIYFAGFVQVGSVSLFGQGSTIAYQADAASSGLFAGMLGPIIIILRLIGYIAFMKGFYILARLGGHQAQPGTLGKGMIHIFGGILAINIESTYTVLMNTLGVGTGI